MTTGVVRVFQSVKFENSLGVGKTLYMALGTVACFALASMVISNLSFGRLGWAVNSVASERLPQIFMAQSLSAESQQMVEAAPSLIAAVTLADKNAIYGQIEQHLNRVQQIAGQFTVTDETRDSIEKIHQVTAAFGSKLGELNRIIGDRFSETAWKREQVQHLKEVSVQYQDLLRWPLDHANAAISAAAYAGRSSDLAEVKANMAALSAASKTRGVIVDLDRIGNNVLNILLIAASEENGKLLPGASVRTKLELAKAKATFDENPDLAAAEARNKVLDQLNTLANSDTDSIIVHRQREIALVSRANDLYSDLETETAVLQNDLDELSSSIRAQSASDTSWAHATLSRGRYFILGSSIACVLTIIGSLIYVSRRIVRRFNRLQICMEQIAHSNLDVEPPVDGQDEITKMGEALRIFRDTAREVAAANRRTEAERSLAAAERRQAMLGLADRFEANIKQLVAHVAQSATQMHDTAGTMVDIARRAGEEAGSAATASTEASANVAAVASAAEQLAGSITEISRQVQQSANIAHNAVAEATSTEGSVHRLTEAASRIGEVVNLIADIAAQTNLLALNATIEAARAGHAGKGFAVVAGEVKLLATQTGKATGDISAQVGAMQAATREVVASIRNISETIHAIDGVSAMIAAAVEEQDATTREIARNVTQAAAGSGQVMSSISIVTDTAQETGQAAGHVLIASETVSGQARSLTSEVDRFLDQIRGG